MNVGLRELKKINFDESLPLDSFWSTSSNKEDRIHKIHSYPAKFPAFLISKAVQYAERSDIEVKQIGDMFCGCGTTALESAKLNKDFYGWDINPVATLIAKVKSNFYQTGRIKRYFNDIKELLDKGTSEDSTYFMNHERINYWFHQNEIIELQNILYNIKTQIPEGKYQDFFLCAFSNILKGCSRWLTKSIKPQIDPNKVPNNAYAAFDAQVRSMLKAFGNVTFPKGINRKTNIKTENFLNFDTEKPFLDLVITSPPYVTSYEYADLHQLSTLWLGYVEDYRDLREGTIGSMYHEEKPKDFSGINEVGQEIVEDLKKDSKRKALSVGKYFIDMKKAVKKSYAITNNKGMNIFVIGNTAYKGVKVDNAKYLTLTMLEEGFRQLEIYKRKVGSKILTPYRDKKGRFSSDPTDRKVYNYEFIVVGKK